MIFAPIASIAVVVAFCAGCIYGFRASQKVGEFLLARGAALDEFGSNVGIPRMTGEGDAAYRERIIRTGKDR